MGTITLRRAAGGPEEQHTFSLWGVEGEREGSLNVASVCRHFKFDQGFGITINGIVVDIYPDSFSMQSYEAGATAEVAGDPLQGAGTHTCDV